MLTCISAFWIHIPVLAWAVAVNLFGRICPLTTLEKKLMRVGGQEDYEKECQVHYPVSPPNLESNRQKIEVRAGEFFLLWHLQVYSYVLKATGGF